MTQNSFSSASPNLSVVPKPRLWRDGSSRGGAVSRGLRRAPTWWPPCALPNAWEPVQRSRRSWWTRVFDISAPTCTGPARMPGDPSDRPRNPLTDRSPAMKGLAAERRVTSRNGLNVTDAFGDEARLPLFDHIASIRRAEPTTCGLCRSRVVGTLKCEDPVGADEGILNAKRTSRKKRYLRQGGARIRRANVD